MLAVGLVRGQFGELCRLPVWLQDLSPFRHSSAMPLEPFTPVGTRIMGAIALLGAGLAAFLIARRDLTAGVGTSRERRGGTGQAATSPGPYAETWTSLTSWERSPGQD